VRGTADVVATGDMLVSGTLNGQAGVFAGSTATPYGLVVTGPATVTTNVGIGNTNPAARLHINGSGQSDTNFDPTAPGVAVRLTNSTANGGDGGALVFGAGIGQFAAIKGSYRGGTPQSVGDVVFMTRGDQNSPYLTERMRLDKDGDVNIGQGSPVASTPTPRLLVNGEIQSLAPIRAVASGVNGTIYAKQFNVDGAGYIADADGTIHGLRFRLINSNTDIIDSAGKVYGAVYG
jgi:hypothetical protein